MRTVGAWIVMSFAVIGLWQLSMNRGWVSPAALATPTETAAAIPSVLAPSGDLDHVKSTMLSSLLAFLWSVPVGVGVGLMIVRLGAAGRPWEFLLDFLRSVPATALVPVFLILFGLNSSTKIFIGMFSSALVISMATIIGLSTNNKTRAAIADIYRLPRVQRALVVDLPEVLPQLFVGFRAGISLALILVVVAEMMVGGDTGLGRVIADMRYTDDKPRQFAALTMTGAIGYSYNVGLRWLETSLVHWKGY